MIAAALMGVASWFHSLWSWDYSLIHLSQRPVWIDPAILIGAPIGIYLCISITQSFAARLTAWEAAYRGYRLPRKVVIRALYYHTADWLPVALLGLLTTSGYILLIKLRLADATSSGPKYLMVVSGEVVFCAGYMFKNYWTAMRNLMYANR